MPSPRAAEVTLDADPALQRAAARQVRDGLTIPPWADFVAWLLDDAIRIPGTRCRIGLDALLGFLLPGAGDILTNLAGFALLALAFRLRLPRNVLYRMVANLLLDLAIGIIPVIGDVFDITVRSNRKNLILIRTARNGGIQPLEFRHYALLGLCAGLVITCASAPAYVLWRFFGAEP